MLPHQNRSPSSSLDLKTLSLSVSFKGWRFPNRKFRSWAIKMSSLHKPTWIQAGIFEAVMASTRGFSKDTDLLLGLAEKWCPDTNTFVFPWGEATITLEDVLMLLGFSVLGSPVFAALDGSGDRVKEELVKESLKIKKDHNFVFVSQEEWTKRFMNCGGDDELEHVAFLALWLSYFVFPSAYYHIDEVVFSVAIHVARGTRIALAPAVLAHLYAELTLLKHHIREFTIEDKIELRALFKLVQVWTWERFKELQPQKTNKLLIGEPRLSLWYDSTQRRSSSVRKVLEDSKVESFEWRPYTRALENWKFPLFYPENAMWVPVGTDLDAEFITFARCVKMSKLVGIDCVEHYFPNRVASQFGLIQDVLCHVNRNKLSKEAAWDEYNKPLDELTLYIPSRCPIPWWKKSSSEWWKKLSPKENQAVESALTPRNIIGDDYDDTSDSVPSGCKRWKSMKQLCEDNDEDDRLTVAQVMRLRKKNAAMCSSDEVLLSEVLKKLGDGFPERLKRSRYLRTIRNVRSEIKIGDCGGSAASREVPLGDLFDKELVKRKSECLGKNRAREADDDESGMDCYDNVTNAKKIRVETVVAPREIKQKSEETETRSKAASENNSLDPPLGANVEVVVSPPETRQNCGDEVDIIEINAEKKKLIMVGDGPKEAECLLHEDGDKQNRMEDDDDERLKQRKNAIEELALTLEARMMKVEKTLAKIREWKTIEMKRGKNGVSV